MVILAGFVYIMSNPAFPDPDLIRIGKSKKEPTKDWIIELNQSVPEPFKLEYYAYVEDESSLERLLHQLLEVYRTNTSREFFSYDLAKAIITIRDEASDFSPFYDKVFHLKPFELERAIEKKQNALENVAYREAGRLENIRLQKAGENKLPNYLTDKKNKEDLDSRFKKRYRYSGIICVFLLVVLFFTFMLNINH